MREKVSGEARPACSCSSSAGSLLMIGISATRGWPIFDLTSIWPSPSADAPKLAETASSANTVPAILFTTGLTPIPCNDSSPQCRRFAMKLPQMAERIQISNRLRTGRGANRGPEPPVSARR